MKRCSWVEGRPDFYIKYHDDERGIITDISDRYLFEMLVLEGAQAGLFWETILKKRAAYKDAYSDFMLEKIAQYDDVKIQSLINNPGIVRNKSKIKSSIRNAEIFFDIVSMYGSFWKYLETFWDGNIIHNGVVQSDISPTTHPLSDLISKDLYKKGMRYVGPKIIYSYLQAIGIIHSHEVTCFLYK